MIQLKITPVMSEQLAELQAQLELSPQSIIAQAIHAYYLANIPSAMDEHKKTVAQSIEAYKSSQKLIKEIKNVH